LDENLNCEEIGVLTRLLVAGGKVGSSAPAWYKTRVSHVDGAVLFTIPGGVAQDSVLRQPNGFVASVGKDKRGEVWSDARIAAMLVSYFTSCDVLVVLSADTHKNQGGLWDILNQSIRPNLPDGCSLVVLFKDGNTSIVDYCQKVQAFVGDPHFESGYIEYVF
jgi:hypothetical protein